MASGNLSLEELTAAIADLQGKKEEAEAKQARVKRLSMLEFGDTIGGMVQPDAEPRDARMVSLGMYALGRISPPR